MAKKKIEDIKINLKEYYKGFHSLYEYSFFVYEVDVFVSTKGSYFLYDSFNVSLKEFRKEGRFYTKKGNINVIREYTLKAAPEEWLLENKYILQL